jgi:hypothetical protein
MYQHSGMATSKNVGKIDWQQMGTKHKSSFIRHDHPFPNHAKEQLKERYGVEFSDAQWVHFGRVLRDPNWTIRLSDAKRGGYFCACYFMGHWYLLICASDGTVKTVFPRLSITDEDKLTLMRNDRYRRINNDEFRVWRTPHSTNTEMTMPSKKTTGQLPSDEELPTAVSQSAESILSQF